MKKLVGILLLFSAGVAHAESVQFVTTLSSPLGVFNRLQTADSTSTTSIPTLNYCTDKASNAVLSVRTSNESGALFTQLHLLSNATLADQSAQVSHWKTPSVTLGSGGAIEVNRIIVSGLNPSPNSNTSKMMVSGTQFLDDPLSTQALKVASLKVNNTTWFPNVSAQTNNPAPVNWTLLSLLPISCKNNSDCPANKNVFVLTNTENATPEEEPEEENSLKKYLYAVGCGSYQWSSSAGRYISGCGASSWISARGIEEGIRSVRTGIIVGWPEGCSISSTNDQVTQCDNCVAGKYYATTGTFFNFVDSSSGECRSTTIFYCVESNTPPTSSVECPVVGGSGGPGQAQY